VDWPPIFDLFARHRIPDTHAVGRIRFSTANPGISASSHWLTIEAQEHALGASHADVQWDPRSRTFSGSTTNVARIAFALDRIAPGGTVQVQLDGQSLTNLSPISPTSAHRKAHNGTLRLAKSHGQWEPVGAASLAHKGPHRYGPFKEAFAHRMVFVYATRGTPEENAWAFAKARFDSESFRYRGNASIELIADTDFQAGRDQDRGVILYGNADSNAAWKSLLADSPVQVHRNGVRIGNRETTGADLACLFLRPRPGSNIACVGVVSGTGLAGCRLTDRVPYFLAGVALPDVTVIGADALEKGWDGARAAGYFGLDWSVENGEFAWAGAAASAR
jgi:hypothetical protein